MAVHNFQIDARAVIALGRESIREPGTAILELVKNAYDADASVVRVEIEESKITISDDGDGMDAKKIQTSWLRIGSSEKKNVPYTNEGRRKIGEKGVGRLSADRLGAELHLRSQAENKKLCEVKVDWSLFEGSERLDSVAITVNDKAVDKFSVPDFFEEKDDDGSVIQFQSQKNSRSNSGTILEILNLREEWDDDDVKELRLQLGTLVSPVSEELFQIQLVAFGEAEIVGSPLEDVGRASFVCKIPSGYTKSGRERKDVVVDYSEWYGTPEQEESDRDVVTKVLRGEVQPSDVRAVGPVDISLTYVPKKKDFALSVGLSYSELSAHLKTNAGVRVFRDGVRVYPYGDPNHPEGDWLELAKRKASSPDAITRKAFKVPPKALVGAVFINRDENDQIIDISGREGLLHNNAYKSLKKIVDACLKRLENLIVRNQPAPEDEPDELTPRQAAKKLSRKLVTLNKDLSEAKDTLKLLPKKKRESVRQLELDLAEIGSEIGSFGEQVDRLIDENTLRGGLATIGIAATTFSHETLGHVQSAYASSAVARAEFEDADQDFSHGIEAINRSLEHLKSIEAWGKFALDRVRKDKRKFKKLYVDRVTQEFLRTLRPVSDITQIELLQKLKSKTKVKAFAMDLESIIMNLLANAYYFCRLGGREVWIVEISTRAESRAGKSGVCIAVADTGPGVPANERKKIWDPLYTTKVDYEGTGLGLAIVASIVDDYKGECSVRTDRNLKGARFEVWIPER